MTRKIFGTTRCVGSGTAVSAFNVEDSVRLQFKRPLRPEDVEDGKLLPINHNFVRKGKRITTLTLSAEAEEALFDLLAARKQARERSRWVMDRILSLTHARLRWRKFNDDVRLAA